MTTTETASAPPAAPTPQPGFRSWLRRNRIIVTFVVGFLLLILVLTLLTAGNQPRGGYLDPDNPGRTGARAVARVVSHHGVELTVVRRAAELRRTTIDPDTTVMVTSSGNLGSTTARQLQQRSAAAGQVVMTSPSPTLVEAFALPLLQRPARVGKTTSARCDDPLLGDLSIEVPPTLGYAGRGDSSAEECFEGDGERPGSLVVRFDESAPVYAVGGTDLFTNDHVDRADNAAAALRLLGAHRRLVWYVPDTRDVAVGDSGSFFAQLPRGLFPALWLIAFAVVATMLWRGRRLGPLVVEPLPVVVKAVESTQGRGRLYRRVRDRAHVSHVLRSATTRRLATLLRLPTKSTPWDVAEAVARVTNRDPRAVHEVLVERPVTDDKALIRLAGDLDDLEKEVHDA